MVRSRLELMTRARRLWTGMLVVAGALAASHRETESDLFFHLELGRAVLRHGARTVPEPTAFSTFDPEVVVPAWLWDILAYGAYSMGGFTAIAVLTLVTAAVASLLIALFVDARTSRAPFVVFAFVSAAGVTVASLRFAMRPQTLFMAILPAFLLLAQRYSEAEGRRRMAFGAGLVLTALVWAQLHGSFVLAPAIFGIFLAPGLRGRDAEGRREDGLVFVLILATLLTSAAGPNVIGYILEHSGGFAVQHIREAMPPDWSTLPELASPSAKALTALWIFAIVGLVRGRQVRWMEASLAVLGLLLFSRWVRFVAVDAVLTLPLAARGAEDLAEWARGAFGARARRALTALALFASAFVLLLHASETGGGDAYGGGFGLGVSRDAFAFLAARYVSGMPRGTRVLTDFNAGPVVGFEADGAVRTYVDGRTPMYFDDADFGLYREAFGHADALERAIDRFSVQAAVVRRDEPACEALARTWVPVVVEARFTTFVPPGTEGSGAAIRGVRPCGPVWFGPEACEGDRLAADLARLDALGPSPSNEMIRAARAILCSAGGIDTQAALTASERPFLAAPHRRLRIRRALAGRHLDGAYGLMQRAVEEGDYSVVAFLYLPEAEPLGPARRRALLEPVAEALDDDAPPDLRARIASECVALGDAECVRFQAQRAAARGERGALPSLRWLVRNHPTERVRADAAAWVRLLEAEGATPSSTAP